MRMILACTRAAIFLAASIGFQAFAQQTTNSILTGQWDFNQKDLSSTVGTGLQYLDGTATLTTFQTNNINGLLGTTMGFPAADPSQGYLMFHGAKPNGGGTNVNLYTLVMDLFWPVDSDGSFRALFNTDTNNLQDAVMFVNPDNAVGINNDYAGEMLPETWYRLALSYNLPNQTVTRYLNGTNIGTVTLDAGVDSRYSLQPALILFTSADGATAAGLVDRIQFYSDALTDDQVAALGSPLGDGGTPPVSTDVKIDSIKKIGNRVEITFSGSGTLQLQKKPSITDTNWSVVGQAVDGGTISVLANDKSGFFRVQKL